MQRPISHETCTICEDEKVNGIHLNNLFICTECERNIVYTRPREEKYHYYLNKLKKIDQPSFVYHESATANSSKDV